MGVVRQWHNTRHHTHTKSKLFFYFVVVATFDFCLWVCQTSFTYSFSWHFAICQRSAHVLMRWVRVCVFGCNNDICVVNMDFIVHHHNSQGNFLNWIFHVLWNTFQIHELLLVFFASGRLLNGIFCEFSPNFCFIFQYSFFSRDEIFKFGKSNVQFCLWIN